MTGLPPPYRVSAYNTAKQSENKMHDDAVARRFGFSGGLVPGVDVIAYMMHVPVARWGRDFLERGTIEARFIKPVYDGETATVSAEEDGDSDGMALTLESRGETCATGRASLPAKPPAIAVADYLETAPVAARKPVDSQSYPLGRWLGTTPRQWSRDDLRSYLGDIREAEPVFAADGLLHPGLLQRIMNWVLVDNAMLGPWIHVGSRMQLLSAASVGDDLQARAKVIGNYDKKGHRFVELDSLIVANGERAVAHCHHIAIVEPRALAAA